MDGAVCFEMKLFDQKLFWSTNQKNNFRWSKQLLIKNSKKMIKQSSMLNRSFLLYSYIFEIPFLNLCTVRKVNKLWNVTVWASNKIGTCLFENWNYELLPLESMGVNRFLLVPIGSNRLESIGNGSKYKKKNKKCYFYDDHSQAFALRIWSPLFSPFVFVIVFIILHILRIKIWLYLNIGLDVFPRKQFHWQVSRLIAKQTRVIFCT